MQENEKNHATISIEEYLKIRRNMNKKQKRRTYLYINRGLIVENTNGKWYDTKAD